MNRNKRKEAALDTLDILKRGYFVNLQGEKISIVDYQNFSERNTKLYTPEELTELIEEENKESERYKTEFEVNRKTTLNSVRDEFKFNQNIACLNFASAKNPGGGFLGGSQAQEESLARATGLYTCQLKAEEYYNINRKIETSLYSDYMIYSPSVIILKDEDGNIDESLNYCSIITAPAVNAGAVNRNEPSNVSKIEPCMRRRINMVLEICKTREYEVLILGAWGWTSSL